MKIINLQKSKSYYLKLFTLVIFDQYQITIGFIMNNDKSKRIQPNNNCKNRLYHFPQNKKKYNKKTIHL